MTIDLNADVGEGYDDEPLLEFLSSVNVACGGHTGDEASMHDTVERAAAAGLCIGAHPSFEDREGFGRRVTTRDPETIEQLVSEQTLRLAATARAQGVSLSHVKPHGALYNLAAADRQVADAVARGVRRADPSLALVGLAGSHSLLAARDLGLAAVAEGFVDRGYDDDGFLAPRDHPGGLIAHPEATAARAVALATRGELTSVTGRRLRVSAETLCLHGDTPGAVAIARSVRAALEDAGVCLAAPQPR